ncbi:hypothetical protein Q7P37_007878 [Cladosporium fusiforme]
MLASGFTNAPVSKLLVFGIVSTAILATLTDTKYFLWIEVRPHLLDYWQYWRLLTWQLAYTNSAEVLFAAMTFYQLRVIERLWGSRKFAYRMEANRQVSQSFLISTYFYTALIPPILLAVIIRPLSWGHINYLPSGPTPLLFALLAQYHAAVPYIYKYRLSSTLPANANSAQEYGILLTSKATSYLLPLQLALAQLPGSAIAAGVGWIVGFAYRREILPGAARWRVPTWIVGGGEQKERYDSLRRRMEGEAGRATGVQAGGAAGQEELLECSTVACLARLTARCDIQMITCTDVKVSNIATSIAPLHADAHPHGRVRRDGSVSFLSLVRLSYSSNNCTGCYSTTAHPRDWPASRYQLVSIDMSQQHGFPPPPPPPPPSQQFSASPGGGTAPYFTQQRRRPGPAQPPSITTNFLRSQGVGSQSHTPASALSPGHSALPYSPATPATSHPRTPSAGYPDAGNLLDPSRAHLQSPASPGMAQQPYNPRQWSGHGSHLAYSQQPSPLGRVNVEITGMENAYAGSVAAMPSPPPPYSPETPDTVGIPHGVRPSPEQIGFVSSPLAAESSSSAMPPTTTARHSPQLPRSPAFPPPPGQSSRNRERSASGQRLLNTIHSLTGRGKQPANHEFQSSQSVHYPAGTESPRAPATRRAASTGHMFPVAPNSSSPHRAVPTPESGRSSPEGSSWRPGMPLPGPPPGPPPPGMRSQSLNRYPASSSSRSNSATSDQEVSVSLQRRAAAQPSTLGPVPPTPADWTETDDLESAIRSIEQAQGSNAAPYQPLRINTGAVHDLSITQRPTSREGSSDGIRERRSKSRAARDGGSGSTVMSPASDDSRPSDFLSSTLGGSISQRREHMRKISGYASVSAAPPDPSSVHSKSSIAKNKETSQQPTSLLTPPYTPAVGNQSGESSQRRILPVQTSSSHDRPISHLLNAPNEESSAIPAPLSPARPASSKSLEPSSKLDNFYQQAIERHRSLIEREAAAASDEERLEIFANFLVHESRLRRDRYQNAYNNMAGEVMDLTRDMWRSYTRDSKRAITPSTSMSSMDPTIPSWASDSGLPSAQGAMPSSASSMGEFTPATDTASFGDSADLLDRADSRQWGEHFKPSLSPIPSMAVSTVPDEDSSRGRTASRWWEQSDSAGSVGRPDRIEKSHRETKYMGVNPATLRDEPHPSPNATRSTPPAGATDFSFGSDEYPAEKTGWHESSEYDTPMATPARPEDSRKSSNAGANTNQLDVSRLVTLPPPYPRHHPAVSNSHPQLSELRNTHRQLASQEEIQRIRDAYLDKDWALQRSQQEDAKKRRNRIRTSIQEKLNTGTISFADAAEAEARFEASEADRARTDARAAFETYEHAAQEEGDEHPERLEKLTLLKWLFEAGEVLHKEMAELHAQRGEKYSEVVLTPYRLANQADKIAEAESFFAKDRRERQEKYAREALTRITELQDIMEHNVARGVEDQLSAFWDIAPGLLEIVQAVPYYSPQNLASLDIKIPAQEYEENPGLLQFPLQYLYSLLEHAGKSARQFIESQVNLLCLLHEVRGARAKAALKVREVEVEGGRYGEEGRVDLMEEISRAKSLDEMRLDGDLKEKVGEVERQWREALGEGLEMCKEGVRGWLVECGGWVEGLEG